MGYLIKVLGNLVVEENGRFSRITNSAKGTALLAYLIVTDETQPRDGVADLLWEATSTEQARRNLRELLTRVRKWIPDLQATRKTIAFRASPDTFVDLFALRDGLHADDLSQIDAALQLYRGDLLAAFYLEGIPRFNEWLALERERLRRQVLEAYRHLCEAYAAKNEWKKGITAVRRWLALDDLNEEATRCLMQLLANNGNLAGAMDAYEQCRLRLDEELGIEPDPATTELLQQIRQMKTAVSPIAPALILPDAGTLPEPGALPPHAYLPYHRNNDFTGREATLLRLGALLLPHDADPSAPRAAAVVGMGGLGKTQLAVEFCYRYGRFFSGGVYWINFAQADMVAEEIAAIGDERRMGLYRETDFLTLADKLGRIQRVWQENTPRLLVFDNCEDERLFAEWMPITGGCRVLLTCRRAAWSRELNLETVPLAVLSASEGDALLRHLAPDIDADIAASISTEVGGLPLALHLAGSFLARYRQISPSVYLEQLRDQSLLRHPSLQGRGVEFSPTGHELHLSRTFALNIEQLDPANEIGLMARKLLAHAACFSAGDPFPKQILQATAVDDEQDFMEMILVEDGLTQLVKLGFIEIEERGMIIMHPLLVAFTAEFLIEYGAIAHHKVGRYIALILNAQKERGEYHYSLPLPPSHLLTMIEAEETEAAVAVYLSNILGRHLQDLGEYGRARPYHERALTLSEAELGATHLETAECLDGLGGLCWNEGDYDAARDYWKRALAIHQTLGLHSLETALLLKHLGVLSSRVEEYEAAQFYYEEALIVMEEAAGASHPNTALVLNNIGELNLQMGAWETARPYLERSLAIMEKELGRKRPLTAAPLNNLGSLFSMTGDFENAQSCLEQALAIWRDSLGEDHPDTAKCQRNLGILFYKKGEFTTAEAYLQQALSVQEKRMGRGHVETAVTLIGLGELYQQTGRFTEANATWRQAQQILQKTTSPVHMELHRVDALLNSR